MPETMLIEKAELQQLLNWLCRRGPVPPRPSGRKISAHTLAATASMAAMLRISTNRAPGTWGRWEEPPLFFLRGLHVA